MNEIIEKDALWWEKVDNDKILCTLCPRYCKLSEGQAGFCYIRQNQNGKLISTGYGRPTGFAIDPIEKKPLNHFYPGSNILSFGTAGCNLGCKFCQNWNISKAKLDDLNALYASPEDVVSLAVKHKTPSIAYTYNDPVIFGEYVIDISKIARDYDIKNVMVTAGYIDKNARKDVFKFIDAANVDLKAFTEEFYHKITYSHLNNVLDTLIWLKNDTDIWFEITTLLIPSLNDNQDELKQEIDWILNNLGDSVPLHFTAYHPDFKIREIPATPAETLINARELAMKMGLNYCYIGNVFDKKGQSTYCPNCHEQLIERSWHSILKNRIAEGKCPSCNKVIEGRF